MPSYAPGTSYSIFTFSKNCSYGCWGRLFRNYCAPKRGSQIPPLLCPAWMHISCLISCRCVPLPEGDTCRLFGINEYAIDISSKLEVETFRRNLLTLIEAYRNVSACVPFLNASVCTVTYVPCNSTIHKLLPTCENECEVVIQSFLECLTSLANNNNFNFDFFITFTTQLNCSNPATYLPDVPANLYSSQEFCVSFVLDTDIIASTSM